MEYVTPPRAALVLLNFFASEPDLAHVVGDLSEEFQQRVSAHGQAAAKLWYWRETFRNAKALGKRELLRTPGKVLALTLLTFVIILFVIPLMAEPLQESIQWARIPTRYWATYEVVFPVLFWFLVYVSSGAIASLLLRAREFALLVSYAAVSSTYVVWVLYVLSYSSAKGRLPRNADLFQLIKTLFLEWAGTIIFYSIGCFWIRWRRLARLSSRAR